MEDIKKPFAPEKLSIIDFKLNKAQVDAPEDFEPDNVDGHKIDATLKLGFKLEEELVKCDLYIDVTTQSEELNVLEAKGTFLLSYIIKVEGLSELTKLKGDVMDLHPDLAISLSSITYSTSRGVLITRLQGTPLQNMILPVVDPLKLLEDSFTEQ
ncbi:MAG: hypothetical protein EOO46_19285 [Flavobacterium sp.]|nr:MAG: hypothetical protein EOO46_19285 [Flavobacterium sp.]